MSDGAGILRDRVKLVRLIGDFACFTAADALWNECASGRMGDEEVDLALVVAQVEGSLGRLVEERDFLARVVSELGEKELDARIFANPDGRFTEADIATLRTIVTERGSITDTLVGRIEGLPDMYSSRVRRLRSVYDLIRAGDESVFTTFGGGGCCDAAGVGLAIGLFGGPLGMAAAGAQAIYCCG